MNEILELKKTLDNQDCVEYELYIITEPMSIEQAQEHITKILLEIIPHDYIWQKESFIIRASSSKSPAFTGTTHFGENIDDEWFIVRILLELTRRLTWLVARVWDNDGQFIMIESAEYLPDWCNKSGDQETLLTNRVFLYKGEVHVIPPPTTPGHLKYLPSTLYTEPLATVQEGLSLVTNTKVDTRASEQIQKCIKLRTESSLKHYRQRTRCYLPKIIIALLKENPQLISHAVRAFIERDSQAMRRTTEMKQFAPHVDDSKFSYAIVSMSRCQYAQLLSQPFSPPKILSKVYKDHNKNKALEIGLKIVCGFEMMYFDENQEAWKQYVNKLKTMGYFKQEREGSALYKQLEADARKEFKQPLGVAHVVDELTKRVGDSYLTIESTNEKGDSDAWLDDAAPLTEYFETKQAQMGHDQKVNQLIGGMKSFIQGESDYEGIETSLEEMMSKAFSGLDINDIFDEDDLDEAGLNENGDVQNIKAYMRAMDAELNGKKQKTKEEEQEEDEEEKYGQDYVMLKNLLESVKAQGGRTGPTSNLLQQLGIDMPFDEDE
jgi:hypothetical protein